MNNPGWTTFDFQCPQQGGITLNVETRAKGIIASRLLAGVVVVIVGAITQARSSFPRGEGGVIFVISRIIGNANHPADYLTGPRPVFRGLYSL